MGTILCFTLVSISLICSENKLSSSFCIPIKKKFGAFLGIELLSSLLILNDIIPRKRRIVIPNPIVIITIELRLL